MFLTLLHQIHTPAPSTSEAILQAAARHKQRDRLYEKALRQQEAIEFAARVTGADPANIQVPWILGKPPDPPAKSDPLPVVTSSPVVWRCRCVCGVELEVPSDRLREAQRLIHGPLGHYLPESSKELRRAHPVEYKIWRSIWNRCRRDRAGHMYEHYGARGIDVDERWAQFKNFLEDMGPRPSFKHSVDRRDVHGHYTRKNCRWASPLEQARNRQKPLATVVYRGETMLLADFIHLGVAPPGVVRSRVVAGWDLERALTTRKKRKKWKWKKKKAVGNLPTTC